MSNPITIYFELDENVDIEEIKNDIEQGLLPIEEIEESDVQIPEQRFTGLEIAAAIGAVILVTENAGKLIDTSTELVNKLTELVRSIKGLKAAIVETPDGPRPLVDMTAAELVSLAQEEY